MAGTAGTPTYPVTVWAIDRGRLCVARGGRGSGGGWGAGPGTDLGSRFRAGANLCLSFSGATRGHIFGGLPVVVLTTP